MFTKIILTVVLVIVTVIALKLLKIVWYLSKYEIKKYQLTRYYNSEEFKKEVSAIKQTLDYKIKQAIGPRDVGSVYEERLDLTPKGKKLLGQLATAHFKKIMSYQSLENRTMILNNLDKIKNKKLANKAIKFIFNETILFEITYSLSKWYEKTFKKRAR